MKIFFRKKYQTGKNKQKGYAILFTVVIVSAVSVITAGLTNSIYKQLVLSSLARDSQAAFYESDTATDCALYADRVSALKDKTFTTTIRLWTCGQLNLRLTPTIAINGGYSISPVDESSLDPCFRIIVAKAPTTDADGNPTTATTIKAKGYNMCDTSGLRTVEREIEIKYNDQ